MAYCIEFFAARQMILLGGSACAGDSRTAAGQPLCRWRRISRS